MEWHEPITALRAARPDCAECACHVHRLRGRVTDRDYALEEWRGAWHRRARAQRCRALMDTVWWATAVTRELQWHLAADHHVVVGDPGWRVPPEDDNEEMGEWDGGEGVP